MGSIRALAALFRYRSIRALAALFRYRSIRALCRPIGKADTGSGYGYVLTALRAYASAAAAIGMRQYAAFLRRKRQHLSNLLHRWRKLKQKRD